MKFTRRGEIVVFVLVSFLISVAIVYAYVSGQNDRCRWVQQHGTRDQVRSYCVAGR